MSLLVSQMSLTIEQTSNPFHPFVHIEAQVDDDEDEDDHKSILGSPSLSSFPHNAVELIDDNDENDKTLYQRWNVRVNGDDEENDHWDAMLARARQHARVQSSSQQTLTIGQNKMLPEEVLPQDLLLYPQEGDAPLWRLRCHISPSRIP